MKIHRSAKRNMSFSHLKILSLCCPRFTSPKSAYRRVPPKNNVTCHPTPPLYGKNRLHSSSHGDIHTPQRCKAVLHVVTLQWSSSPSPFVFGVFQSHVHRLNSWKVFIGEPHHFFLVFLPFATSTLRLANLSFLPTMPSNTRREQVTSLNRLWGGTGWIPPFLHNKTREPLTVETLFHRDFSRLLSISKRAAYKGIALPSLYKPGGLLHRYMVEVSSVVMWTDKTAFRALRKAKKLKWELPKYKSATDQTTGDDEPTMEQSNAAPSREIIDLVSDNEEIDLPTTAKDVNLRIPAVEEGPRSAPLQRQYVALDVDRDGNPPSRSHHERLRMSHHSRERGAPSVSSDILAARAQLKNAEGLSDADIGVLVRHLRRFSV